MKKRSIDPGGTTYLRMKAEEQLKKSKDKVRPADSKADMLKLIHELEVHQIELELQSEELILANNQARAASEKFEELYDFAPSGYFTLSRQGTILEMNLCSARMLGKARSLLINRRFDSFIRTDSRSVFKNFLKEIFQGRSQAKCELSILSDNNSQLYLYLTGIISENTEQCHVTATDITERKKAEKDLLEAKEKAEESEARFRNLMESIDSIAVQGYSPEGITQFWNKASEKLYGYAQQEAIGSSILDLIIPSEMKDEVTKAINEMAGSGEPIPSGELVLKHKNGSPVPVISSHAIVKVPGHAQELFCLDIDITARKIAEFEVEKSKKLLVDLNKRMESVRENERADISREIHDQLGQSLTALKIDMMSLRAKMETDSKEGIVLGGMIKMVNTISMDVQRISSELRPLMLDDLGLAATLEWYCEEFAGRTGLIVELDIEAIQSESIDKDLALYRVAQESLTNIIRHSGAGIVQVSLHIINDILVLTIQDDGIGITQDNIESYKSMGLLGMSERVKQYNGKLEIMAPDKNGTIIRASIPVN